MESEDSERNKTDSQIGDYCPVTNCHAIKNKVRIKCNSKGFWLFF